MSLLPKVALFAATLPLAPLAAQTPASLPPSITVSTSSDIKVTPDRATIRISVQTKAATASVAAADNARRQSAVLKSLQKLGLTNDQLSTADYTVNPSYRYEQNRDPVLTGYEVTNTIIADIHDLTQVGKVIDTAISSGANMISSLDFYASNTNTARMQALTAAVAKSRTEAETAAKAAGGSIISLLELNVGGESSYPPPRPMYRMTADAAPSTPINPGQQTLNVNVTARWLFTQTR